jgi:hypothetical protein
LLALPGRRCRSTVDGLPLSPLRVTTKLIVVAGPPGSPSVAVASAIDRVGRSLSRMVPVATARLIVALLAPLRFDGEVLGVFRAAGHR